MMVVGVVVVVSSSGFDGMVWEFVQPDFGF